MREPTSTLRLAAPGLLLAVAVLLPFIGKPFTIDDTLFMRMAEQALVDPLHPTAFEYVWDVDSERVSTIMPSGPLGAWLLLPAVMLGGAEWAAHSVHFALLLLAIVATVSLARRLELGASASRWSGLFLASSPAVLGMAGTCMPDVPAMAFGILGIERYVAGLGPFRESKPAGRQAYAALLSGVLALALASLARSHALLLPGVLILLAVGWVRPTTSGKYALRTEWRRLTNALLPLLAVPMIAKGVMVVTRDPLAGTGVEDAIGNFFSLSDLHLNLLAFIVHFLFVLPLAVPLWLGDRRRASAGWWVLGTALSLWALDVSRRLREWWPLGLPAGLAFAVLLGLMLGAWQQRHRTAERTETNDDARATDLDGGVRLALVAWLFVAAPVAVYLQLPSKYLLLSAPAVGLLLGDAVRRRRGRYALLAYGVLLGVLILRADGSLAGVQRQMVQQHIEPRIAQGDRVWFAGHWGFQWYAERAGALPLWSGAAPQPGEIIVVDPLSTSRDQLDKNLPEDARTLQELVPLGHPGGRVMTGGAGFFSNQWGFLPWAYSSEPIVTFELWLVKTEGGQ